MHPLLVELDPLLTDTCLLRVVDGMPGGFHDIGYMLDGVPVMGIGGLHLPKVHLLDIPPDVLVVHLEREVVVSHYLPITEAVPVVLRF